MSNRKHAENAAPSAETPAAPAETNTTPAAEAAPAPAAEMRTIKIGEVSVNVPVRWKAGEIMTDYLASCVQAFHERQFINNQEANAKNREKRFNAAKSEAERADNAPLTAADYAALFATYTVKLGNAPRQTEIDKLRTEMALDFYKSLVGQHNANVAAGLPGIFKAPGKVTLDIVYTVRSGKAAGMDAARVEAHNAAVEAKHEAIVAKLLASPVYGPQIEALVAAELERRKAAETPVVSEPDATVVSVDMFD
jgi:hypothetical protein